MKKLLIIASIFTLTNFNAEAQKTNAVKTEKFIVEGVCNDCKKRIEDAAYIKGVKRADWNKETKELVLIYNADKVTKEAVATKIAKAGHTAAGIEASKDAYNKLPSCCAYEHSDNHTH